jgi:hypothetical protein
MARTADEIEARLAVPPAEGAFGEDELDGLDEPVRRYLRTAIDPGAPLVRAARLRIRGAIKLGRWLPFRSTELLAPHHGFLWRARVGGLVTGSDHYLDGEGGLDWRLGGVVPVMQAEGPDVARSAAGRAAGEAVWLPTTLLPRFGVRWEVDDDTHLVATVPVDDLEVRVRLHTEPDGRLRSAIVERWGDPDETGTYATHDFGMAVTAPFEGRAGWFPGTDRWTDEGEFFRYRITALEPVR